MNIGENMISQEIIDFNINPDSDLIVAMAQIPGEWMKDGNLVIHKDPDEQWNLIKQTLEKIKEEILYGRTTDIAIFPEWSVPSKYVYELREFVRGFNSDFILLAGFESITLEHFVNILNSSDNTEKNKQTNLIKEDTDYEEIKGIKPVNFCSIIVKSGNNVKQYFQSKLFPSKYEQMGSDELEILRGTYLLHFKTEVKERSQKFSFIPLICFDQMYEKVEASLSTIKTLIGERKPPDFIFVLQCNPKASHPFIDAALYEYYLCPPNRSLRESTYTLFVNVSNESKLHSKVDEPIYGSCVVFNKKSEVHDTEEYRLNKMDRINLLKVEFTNESNRLYFLKCSLLPNYRVDPRSSRTPITIMRTYKSMSDQWEHIPPKPSREPTEEDSLDPMIDMYCSNEIIKRFDENSLTNNDVVKELCENEILIVMRRAYVNTPKNRIPKHVVRKMEQTKKRLDKLEEVTEKKLSESVDENVSDKLCEIGANIIQSKKIIEGITKRWNNV